MDPVDSLYARHAFCDSVQLAQSRLRGFVLDLILALRSLPCPVLITPLDLLSPQRLNRIIDAVTDSWKLELYSKMDVSRKTGHLRDRLPSALPPRARMYLNIRFPSYRVAYTRLLRPSHSLAIERLRWQERRRARVPRDARLCRLCEGGLEDEAHAMFGCQGLNVLHEYRTEFWGRSTHFRSCVARRVGCGTGHKPVVFIADGLEVPGVRRRLCDCCREVGLQGVEGF